MAAAEKSPKSQSRVLLETCRVFAHAVSRVLWRIEFHGTGYIPPAGSGGFVIAANHQTYFDPVWISIPVNHDIRYLAWDRAFEWPLLGAAIRRLGAMPVRLERGSTVSTLKKALEYVRNGSALVVFPEGQREFADGRLLRFRTGAANIALKAGVPVLPVTIRGGNHVWPRHQKMPRPRKVDIYYHPLIETSENSGAIFSERELTEKIRSTVGSKLHSKD